LANSNFLAGNDYTIADIATFPWIARHDWHDIGLKKFDNLKRWYENISKRKAVKKGYDLLNKGDEIPKV
jgi:GST-like protein